MRVPAYLDLYHLKQEPDQTINDLFAHMQFLWDTLALSNPAWKDPTNAQVYAKCMDQHCLYLFLMTLHDDFELVRGQILHRTLLPTLDKVACDFVLEETRLYSLHSKHTQPTHPVLAAQFSSASSSPPKHFNMSGHGPPSKNCDNNYCRFC